MHPAFFVLFITGVFGVASRVVSDRDPRPSRAWIAWAGLAISLIPSVIVTSFAFAWLWPIGLAATLTVALATYSYRELGTAAGQMLKQPRWLALIALGVAVFFVAREWQGNADLQYNLFTLIFLVLLIVFVTKRYFKSLKKKVKP